MATQGSLLPTGGVPSEPPILRQNPISRTLPFVLVAVAGELSVVLPPGPASVSASIVSAVLLGLTVACFFLARSVLPSWANIVIPLLYLGSALALILATGGTNSGVGPVVLLPVVWAALNLEPWKSVVTLAALAVLEVVTTIVPVEVSIAVRLRKIGIYLAIGGLIAYSVHELRIRIARIGAQRESINVAMTLTIQELEENNRSASILIQLVDLLNACVSREEAYQVIEHSAQAIFGTGGSLSILDPAKAQLDAKCAWGDFSTTAQSFSTNDCWALRRGQPYESRTRELSCEHLRNSGAGHTLCHPLLAQGEIIGVMTVSLPKSADVPSLPAGRTDHFRQYALLVGEQISIWMANFKLRESLRNLSIRDPLTNLFNRRFMEETLDREMSGASRGQDQTGIIQIDVDHFKAFNDTYGHAIGDAVLRAIADVMLGLFRDSDVPCRSGGEEFTMVLPRCSWDTANARATELQVRVGELQIPIGANQVLPQPPTISIGIATSPEHGRTSEALLRAADMALYAAKAAGRNRIARATTTKPTLGGSDSRGDSALDPESSALRTS